LLKKSIHGFFQLAKQKAWFLLGFIFKRLPRLKMAVHPCTAPQAAEKRVFQQPARESGPDQFEPVLSRPDTETGLFSHLPVKEITL
jgi:hypothetical protein